MPYRGQPLSFPYSWLHYLRRAVAFARQTPDQFRPAPEDWDPCTDDRLDQELSVYMDCHFICHSDCEGFYVPIDFPEPVYDKRGGGLPGAILGSSQRALHEVTLAAPLLGITVVDGTVPDETAKVIAKEEDGSSPYWIERKVWLGVFETFRHSVEHNVAVVYG